MLQFYEILVYLLEKTRIPLLNPEKSLYIQLYLNKIFLLKMTSIEWLNIMKPIFRKVKQN